MAIDPGSHKMGCAFFDNDGKFLRSVTFYAEKSDTAARRLWTIRNKYEEFYAINFPNCWTVVTVVEDLPPNQLTPSLPISPGAVVGVGHNVSRLTPETFIKVNVWKSVAKQFGCKMADPKGLQMFEEIPWEFENKPNSEDEADATMMYLAYSWNFHNLVWLGPTIRMRKESK